MPQGSTALENEFLDEKATQEHDSEELLRFLNVGELAYRLQPNPGFEFRRVRPALPAFSIHCLVFRRDSLNRRLFTNRTKQEHRLAIVGFIVVVSLNLRIVPWSETIQDQLGQVADHDGRRATESVSALSGTSE